MSPSPTLRSSKRHPAKPEERPRRPGPGRPPKPVVEYPEPLWERVEAPGDFAAAFDAEIRRHGDSVWGLHKATTAKSGTVDRTTLGAWRRGTKGPQTPASLQVVDLIEDRYRLPQGYLRSRVTHGRAVSGHSLPDIGVAERRRLAWHLPDDFNARTAGEQAEILAWVRSSVLSGGTAYHRYHAEVSKHRFAIRFEGVVEGVPLRSGQKLSSRPEFAPPPRLAREMAHLLRFKTRTLTEVGFQRSGVWGPETASQKVEHLGLLFGALFPLLVGTLFAGAITTLGQIARDGDDRSSGGLLGDAGDAAAIEGAQVGGRLVDRELQVRPSIRLRPGAPVRAMITRDLILEPYRP